MLVQCFHFSGASVPFRINEETSEVSVVKPLDREQRETYDIIVKCTLRTLAQIIQVVRSLHVTVLDKGDNAPYILDGNDTAEAFIEFNRKEVGLPRRFG